MARRQYVVSNVFTALDEAAFRPVLDLCASAEQRIVESDGNFDVASSELARVAGALLDKQSHVTHGAIFGEVFKDEGAAGAYGQQAFADLSTRYLADGDERQPPGEVMPGERRVVVMLTVGYEGERPALERDVDSVLTLVEALQAIVALHHEERLLLAHIHHAPAHPEDKLTDDQLIVNYPELISL